MTSASSLTTNGCIPSGPMDLCMSSLFKCSRTWFSCIDGEFFLLQEASNVGEVYLVEDKNPMEPGDCSSSGRTRDSLHSLQKSQGQTA